MAADPSRYILTEFPAALFSVGSIWFVEHPMRNSSQTSFAAAVLLMMFLNAIILTSQPYQEKREDEI